MKQPRILYTGRFYESSPRGLTIRQGLGAHGAHLETVALDFEVTYFSNWRLKKRLSQFSSEVDLVFLADLSQELMPAVWEFAQSRKIPLICDFFFSMHEALVFDRKVVSPDSRKAKKYFEIDRRALSQANLVLFDTEAHRDYAAQTFSGSFNDSLVVPIGCPAHFFEDVEPVPLKNFGEFNVLFWGSYIPLHGIEKILEAASEIQTKDSGVRFFLIGKKGLTYEKMISLSRDLKLQNVFFVDPIDQKKLMAHIKAADVALGIFGDTDKADRVVPHKVYEALALGVPTITKLSPAYDEFLSHKVCRGIDSSLLAQEILGLKNDSGLRKKLGAEGQNWAREHFIPRKVTADLYEKICSMIC